MRFRKLRIAWSVVCCAICLLLLCLWIRSYWRLDNFGLFGAPYTIAFASQNGCITASVVSELGHRRLSFQSSPSIDAPDLLSHFLVTIYNDPKEGMTALVFPHWFLIPLLALVAAAPWKRFSLRFLLIITTLTAVVLGFAVWSGK